MRRPLPGIQWYKLKCDYLNNIVFDMVDARIIYFDLDGVLADFRKMFVAITGHQPEAFSVDDMWSRVLSVPEFFLSLDVTPEGKRLFTVAQTLGEVQILTATPRKSTYPSAVKEKNQWVHMHFGDVPVIAVEHVRQKSDYARCEDILIDDSADNIRRWSKAGGHGIIHTNLDSTLAELMEITKKNK